MKKKRPCNYNRSVTAKKVALWLQKHKTLKATARATGIEYTVLHRRYVEALEQGLIQDALPLGAPSRSASKPGPSRKAGGRVRVLKPVVLEGSAPADKHGVRRYLFTAAQNNTKIHTKFWENLKVFADYHQARIVVSRFTYSKRWHADLDKANWGMPGEKVDIAWAKELDPYLLDQRAEVAPGLMWCGEMNILPTAVKPTSGLESYTGRASGIFPHAKIAMDSICSTSKHQATKFNYTTGAVTLKNYIQKKEGQKAQFHHCFGALLVEVDREGNWYCRQINADSSGTFYDLDTRVKNGEVTGGHRPAITWGDIHVDQIDEAMAKVAWGEGGIVDKLKPTHQFFHDVLDFYSQNHHEVDNAHVKFRKFIEGRLNVGTELYRCAEWMKARKRKGCKNIVVDSNHHHHLGRWLRERNGMQDPSNAEIWSTLNAMVLQSIRDTGDEPNYLRTGIEAVAGKGFESKYGVVFLDQDASYILHADANGGIENGLHGHDGMNGARKSSAAQYARMGRKLNRAHEHSASIVDSVYTAGCSVRLDAKYVRGPSSWSHSHILTYPNGKRAIFTIWDGKGWA